MSDEKHPGAEQSAPKAEEPSKTEIHYEPTVDNGYHHDDPYAYDEHGDSGSAYRYGESTQPPEQTPAGATTAVVPATVTAAVAAPQSVSQAGGGYNPPPPPKPPDDEDEEDEEGMARMSFLEHLEELRTRIIRILIGFVVAFVGSLYFAPEIWKIIAAPAVKALTNLGFTPKLVAIAPMEQFSIIWMKAPLVVSIFLASPVLVWQVWGFIAPGLYKRERRWAAPFIICTSGLFILGGLFAYFVVFRLGLEFLLGIGRDADVAPMVTISEYFDLFVNVTLGVAIIFELPVVIFFLTLIRVASPRFLLSHSRYAILGIMVLAAGATPTPDVFNMVMFVVPMILLYFLGVFASYILELKREGKAFPWKYLALALVIVLAIGAGAVWLAVAKFGFKLLPYWPFLTK
jgi:sec-independent protein translocase protein TatC